VAGWTGALCDAESIPFAPVFNLTSPKVLLQDTSGSLNESTAFFISFTKVQEISPLDIVVQEFDFQNKAFEITTRSTLWEYTINITASAYIVFSFNTLDQPNNLTNQTFNSTTMKSTIQIFNWTFQSIKNTLRIWTSFPHELSQDTQASYKIGPSGNLQWALYTVLNSTLYAKFVETVQLDGIVHEMQVAVDPGTGMVYFTILHFWNYAVIDPEYSLLLTQQGTGHTSNSGNGGGTGAGTGVGDDLTPVTIGVGVTVVVAAAIAITILSIWHKNRNSYHKALRGSPRLSSRS
jgi:hypothetical protein